MGFLEIVLAVASLASLVLGVGTAIWMGSQKQPSIGDVAGGFDAPRSEYGQALPFVFGTVQLDSPIAVYASPVFVGKPFGWGWPSKYVDPYSLYSWHFGIGEDGADSNGQREFKISEASRAKEMYQVTLDLILAERHRNASGAINGSVSLYRIWYGDSLLWFSGNWLPNGVQTSCRLLDVEPNRILPSTWPSSPTSLDGILPGNVFNAYTTGTGHWFGGITQANDFDDCGEVLGWWTYSIGFDAEISRYVFTTAFGLESVRFYAGTDSEVENDWIATEIFGADKGSTSQHHYPAYPKFTRLVFEDFCWGSGAGIQRIAAELKCTCPAPEIGDSSGEMPNGRDVNPISVLYVLLTSPDFLGGQKMPALDVDSFSTARQQIANEDLGMSLKLERASKALDLVELVLEHVDGLLYLDPLTGLLTVKLNRQATGTIPSFSEKVVTNIPEFSKSTWEATYSQMRLTFNMRTSASNTMYATNVALARDESRIADSNIPESLDETSQTIFSGATARTIAARKLAIANTPLIAFTIEGTRAQENGFSLLDLRPGSTIKFSYAPRGFSGMTCKVLSVDYGTLEDNTVRVKLIQDRYAPAAAVSEPSAPVGPPTPQKPNVSISTYRIETAPYPIARMGLGADARKVLTSSGMWGNGVTSVYPTSSGYNFDRFMILAKAPYAGADKFTAQIYDDNTGTIVETLTNCTYTPQGVLSTAIASDSGGNNQTYPQEAITAFTITGLNPGDLSILRSGDFRDGKNMALIDDEWFLIRAFTVLSSTSIRVDSWSRMLWDSPSVDTSDFTKIPSHSIGAWVWLFDASNVEHTVRKLSSPMVSGLCIVDKDGAETITNPLTQMTNGFVSTPYRIALRNVSALKNNIRVTSGIKTLADRANRMFPPRRTAIAWSSGSASGALAYNVMVLTSQTGQSAITVDFNVGVLGSSEYYSNSLASRESGNLVKRFDSTLQNVREAEENSPNIEGWQSQITKAGNANQMVVYRETVSGTPGTWRKSIANDSGQIVLTGLPSTGVYELDICLYRVPRCGAATLARSMRSTPRWLKFTVNRV